MIESDLLEAGFVKTKNTLPIFSYDWLYQKKVTDENGTRYFVNIAHYLPTSEDRRDEWEADVEYNGVGFMSNPMWIKVGRLNGQTAAGVSKWAEELWERLNPNYYERND